MYYWVFFPFFGMLFYTALKLRHLRAERSRNQAQLVHLCQGNVQLAQRLVNAEMQKDPNLSVSAAQDRAIYFLRRDRN